MSFEATVSTTAFKAFAKPADLNGQPVDVVVDWELEFVDQDNNVIERGIGVDMLKSTLPALNRGDVLTLEAGDQLTLGRRLKDDRYIVTFSATKRGPENG